MKLKLEVTHVDPAKGELSFTPLGSELRGLLSYTGLPQRAIGRCHAGQTVEAEIPLPDFYPVRPGTKGYPTSDGGFSSKPKDDNQDKLITRMVDGKWYKRLETEPHNWEPIQDAIDAAVSKACQTGQPQPIAGCGYVDRWGIFMPYRVAGDAHNASDHDEYKRHFGEYLIENNVGRIAGFLGNTHALAKLESYDRAFADQIRNAHRDLLVIARELARAKKYAEMIA